MVIINSFVYPESTIRFQQRNVRVILDKNDLGLGQLYISEKYLIVKCSLGCNHWRSFCSNISWQLSEDRGFTVPYTDITLHAISKDDNVYPKECIYIITDEELVMPGKFKWMSIKRVIIKCYIIFVY